MASHDQTHQMPKKARALQNFFFLAPSLLPRRAFPVIVMALSIIVLTPTPLLADTFVPFVFYTAPMMVLGLIPIIFIESFVLRRRLGLESSRALGVAAVANIVSTVVGIVLQVIFQFYVAPSSRLSHPSAGVPYGGVHGAEFFGPLFVLFVPLFFISWLSEYPVARLMLKPRRSGSTVTSSKPTPAVSKALLQGVAPRPVAGLFRGMFDANVASYVFLAMIVGALFVYDIRNPPLPLAAASPAVGALHTINTSEVIYSSTYTTGFSPSLAALDGNPSEKPTADAAGLISPALASGEISFDSVVYSATKGRNVRATIGYRLTYKAAPDADGIIRHYSVVARPIKYLGEGTPSFFTDQSGIIRSTTEDRDATATDPPLAG